MELSIYTKDKIQKGTVSLSDSAFTYDFKKDLVHQVVAAHIARQHQGTKAQKSRSEVSGGGAKPWRQKGTGRARAGSIRSPIWRSGGVTFAAKPNKATKKINRKMQKAAVLSVWSELIRQERVTVIESIDLSAPKTKELKSILENWGYSKVLIIIDKDNDPLYLAARNLVGVAVCPADQVDLLSLVSEDRILITLDAIKRIEEKLL